ncbi:AAA-domain-containing protein [Whalleya microplaca]|nr:AAA-domain-containing protein [Whalleya microplaca]
MHTRWPRAFRSAALHPRNPRLLTRRARTFHTSAAARAAADDGNNGPPRDDGNNPEKENGAGDGDSGDKNLFGESNTEVNSESHGRKKPGNGSSLRSRALRNRKPEELPPMQLPKYFRATAIHRFGETKIRSQELESNIVDPWIEAAFGPPPKKDVLFNNGKSFFQPDANVGVPYVEMDIYHYLRTLVLSTSPAERWADHIKLAFEAAAWVRESLTKAIEALESGQDLALIGRRLDFIVAAAHWLVVHQSKQAYGDDSIAELRKRTSHATSMDLLAALLRAKSRESTPSPRLGDYGPIIHELFNGHLPEPLLVGLYHSELFDEIIAFVNADLKIQAPKNVKLTELRRPITIINTCDYSGFSVPHGLVGHIANKMEADVLHLRASDIAHIVGGYLGQDAARAPGLISQLGYTAAKNSGRLKDARASEEDSDDIDEFRAPYAIVMRDDRAKKENKRTVSLMDEYLNGTNRGKSEDLWEDLKINAAIEELVHSADSKSDPLRPLIVHINDFNALNMDLECGAALIGRIRKVVDAMWLDGRKIVLIGTCSTKTAPMPYLNALGELEATERVSHLRLPQNLLDVVESELERWVNLDYLRENDGNIVKMLSSLIEPVPEELIENSGTLGLADLTHRYRLPDSWSDSVLPLAEVYRIASAMIGTSYKCRDGIFSLANLEHAGHKITALEGAKERLFKDGKHIRNVDDGKALRGFFDMQKVKPSDENHEERIKSGLVNAADIRTTFKDVHAPKETIDAVKMLTTLSLIRPEEFSYGVLATDRIPGCLLYGPPGTGKTLLAKAVAKESGANMIEVSGASINNMYVGESEKNVRALFSVAKKQAPMVIFIDEADALLGSRGRRDVGARRETINQFLREWDGLTDTKAFIMVATNRPFDLDDAVLRRLPRKLLIDLPLERDRAAILRIHLKDEELDEGVSIDDLARRTPLYSGSDLKNVCVAAAMAAVRERLEREEREEKGEETDNDDQESQYPWEKRILRRRNFDTALAEIGASVSEDMGTLSAIRKFDERYGDGGGARKRRRGMGFGVLPETADAEEARVRNRRP